MKYKILLKSFLVLALIVVFGGQVYASEITGDLSSSIAQSGSSSEVTGTISNGTTGTVGGGSEVIGTIDNGTIAGIVNSGGTSGGSSSGSQSNGGQVLGASDNGGQVLGATYTPGFPTTGIGPKVTSGVMNLVGLVLSVVTLMAYAYHKMRINA